MPSVCNCPNSSSQFLHRLFAKLILGRLLAYNYFFVIRRKNEEPLVLPNPSFLRLTLGYGYIMKRHLWNSSVSETYCPSWQCPICKKGTLQLRQNSLVHSETIDSLHWHNAEDWGPEYIAYTFSAWADCSDMQCKEQFVLAGTGGIEQEYTGDEDGSSEWVNCFYPKWVSPTLDMIDLPTKCPRPISQALRDAFALYWSQPEACAGRIRVAVEALLSHLRVPEVEITNAGKTSSLRLHRRIELFAKENPEVGNQLMALKWLGNTGSHGNKVTTGDILDGLELLEHSLVEVLEKRSEKMAALAKKLIDRHGPNTH